MDKNYKTLTKKIAGRVARAIYEFSMLEPGSRVMVAISGGKDSMTLLHHLLKVNKSVDPPYEILPIHVRGDFDGCPKDGNMEALIESWGAELTVVEVPIMARLKPGKSMNCYWCSTQRRMELLKYAQEHGYDTIALGHHQDDILETLFMNMAYKGEMSTMPPVMKYDKYPQKVIRPLCLVKEAEIQEFAHAAGFASKVTTCPYGQTSKRKEVREALELLASSGSHVKDSLFKSMANIKHEYLPGGDGES